MMKLKKFSKLLTHYSNNVFEYQLNIDIDFTFSNMYNRFSSKAVSFGFHFKIFFINKQVAAV